jgi:glycosyltransferase involved in cell wall biosynthesis
MKIAFAHDWLNGMRGGERCLDALCEVYPRADIFTLLYEKGNLSSSIENRSIHTSFIQKLPWVFTKYRHYLPLFPTAIEQFDLRSYDLVVSLSHCVAKGILTSPGTCHICYLLTPMRYAWDLYHDYFSEEKIGTLQKWTIPFFINYLRTWDVASSNRVDYFVAISEYVARRVQKYYRRECDVIYPPIDTDFYTPGSQDGDYFLIVSAFAPYKRIDLAIEAFNRLKLPLKIIGKGQEEKTLRRLAGSTIEFLGSLSDEEVRDYYRDCRALIFPGEEDLGLTPLEAQSTGRPVIAYARGGALETVEDGATGLFFQESTVENLCQAVKEFDQKHFDKTKIREQALRFSKERFKQEMKTHIESKMKEYFG